MPTWSFPQGSKPSKHKVTSILKPGKWVSTLPSQNKHTQASEPGLSPALTSLRAPQHAAAWLRAWVSTRAHRFPASRVLLRHPHGVWQPCSTRGRSGCGAPTPWSRCSPRLLPRTLSSFSTASVQQPRSSRKQPVPTLPFRRQPRPVLPTHTALAPLGFRSGLARGLPTSQGIACPGMRLIWLSPPCERWGRLLGGASWEPRAPSPLPPPSQVVCVPGMQREKDAASATRDAEPRAGGCGEPRRPPRVISRGMRLRGGVCWAVGLPASPGCRSADGASPSPCWSLGKRRVLGAVQNLSLSCQAAPALV